MGKITVEEPKSVVEEVEKYECDACGCIEDSASDMFTAFVYDGTFRAGDLASIGQDVMNHPTISHKKPTNKRLLCEHCSGEASNKQLEKRAESAIISISFFSVLLSSGLGLLVYHFLTFTPVVMQDTNPDGVIDLFIVIAASFILVSLISIVCFVGTAYILTILSKWLSSDRIEIEFEKQQ